MKVEIRYKNGTIADIEGSVITPEVMNEMFRSSKKGDKMMVLTTLVGKTLLINPDEIFMIVFLPD